MKRVFSAVAVALVLCAATNARAQAGKVRVGPASDEAPASAPPKGETRKPQPAPTPTPPARTEKANAPAASANNPAPARREEKPADAKKTEPEKTDKAAAALTSSATPAPVVESSSPAVPASDAPARTSPVTAPALNNPGGAADTGGTPANSSKTNAATKNAPATNGAASNPPASSPTASPSNGNSSNVKAPATNTAVPNTAPANVAAPNTNAAVPPSPNTSAPSSPNAAVPPATNAASPSATNAAAQPSSAPASAAPPTAVYRVGIGDVLDIRLLNQSNPSSTLYTVMAGGLLEYPLAGDPLPVTGMTTEEIGARLAATLKRRAVYERPQVVVSVREYASHAVLVSGMVGDPGTKILRREAVPLYVVLAEAQPHPEAGRAIIISHSTGQSATVDLSDPAALNTLVHSGDVVNVQARPREFFYIGGEIASGGQKDFHAGLTLTQALLASGGTTRFAVGKVKVARQGADGRLSTTEYTLKDIEDGKVPDPRLQPGDRIEVVRKR